MQTCDWAARLGSCRYFEADSAVMKDLALAAVEADKLRGRDNLQQTREAAGMWMDNGVCRKTLCEIN